LKEKLKDEPFEILAFPCNQFGNQEPGNADDIKKFASDRGANFTMMEKIDVNGKDTHPVYKTLKGPDGADIRWNFFTKFIVQCSGDGFPIERHDGAPPPLSLEPYIQQMLKGVKKAQKEE